MDRVSHGFSEIVIKWAFILFWSLFRLQKITEEDIEKMSAEELDRLNAIEDEFRARQEKKKAE